MKQLDAEVHGVTPEDVERAATELRAYLPPTPLQHSRAFTEKARCHVYLKIESIQPIRAFKVRGALNKLIRLTGEQRSAGVITASAGNHGMGVAYAAAAFNAPATVYVPETANPFKVEAIRRLGAHVVEAGRNYNGAYVEALRAQSESGATFVHAYDDPEVVAGQGTIASELLFDLADFDTVLVPIGGGGLIGGIVRLDRVSTIADGLAASAPGKLTLQLAQRYVDEVLLVEETEMLRAIRLLFEWEHLLAEPAGAAALAALLYHYRPAPNERVVVILSGGNVTDEVMLQALKTR